jgi:hypothetical protein
MDDDVADLLTADDFLIQAALLKEGLALLPPRTTEYRSGTVRYPWNEREEPATQPIPVSHPQLPGPATSTQG